MKTLPSLAELGRTALLSMQDLFDDETCIGFAQQTDIAKVIWWYSHADSGIFAHALSKLMGWPVIGLAAPGRTPSYLLVESPHGMVDVSGIVALDDLKQRFRNPMLVAERSLIEPSVTDGAGELAALAAMRHLSVAPFTDAGLITALEARIASLLHPAESLEP